MENYEKLLERISRASDLEKEEIDRKIEAKRAKLSGLISKEGAAQIVAAELGINFESERLKLSELVQGMKRANVLGKITKVFPVREFSKNDRSGKIGSFLLGDETSNVRVVLWDVNHINLIEKNEIMEGEFIEITNGSFRNGELHLSGFSDIKKSNERIKDVKEERHFSFGKIKDASAGKNLRVRAVIVQIFSPKEFTSQEGKKKGILNLVLDDGSETIRAVLFGEHINKLGLEDDVLFSLEKFEKKRGEFLGEEKLFSGNFRTNEFFNRLEMIVDNVADINIDELVKELEAKS